MSLDKALTPSHLEAFNWDSHLVREIREEYFRGTVQNFSTENTCDLPEVFQEMIITAKLLGSSIYEIKEVWARLDELWQANYALRTLPKGLKFLRAVSPSESPKVMGLMGIHDPDTLCHFCGVTHCPRCRKEGQNEGTVVNHLWTIHYRLGLMCKKCYGCPSTSSKTLCWHGQKDLPTLRGGRHWQVIIISVTTSQRCMSPSILNRNLDRGTQGRFQCTFGCLFGDSPAPLAQPWRRTKWRRHHLPPGTSHHLSIPALGLNGYCLLHIWNCIRSLPKMLDLKLKVNNWKLTLKC